MAFKQHPQGMTHLFITNSAVEELLLAQQKTRERHRAELEAQRKLFDKQLLQVGMTHDRHQAELRVERDHFEQTLNQMGVDRNYRASTDNVDNLQQLERDLARERLIKKRLDAALQQQKIDIARPFGPDRSLDATHRGLASRSQNKDIMQVLESVTRSNQPIDRAPPQHVTADSSNENSNRPAAQRDGTKNPSIAGAHESTRGTSEPQTLPRRHRNEGGDSGENNMSITTLNQSSVMKDLMNMLDSSTDDDAEEEYHKDAATATASGKDHSEHKTTVAVPNGSESNSSHNYADTTSATVSRTIAVSHTGTEHSSSRNRTAMTHADESAMTRELRHEILSLRNEYQDELEQELEKRVRQVCHVPTALCCFICVLARVRRVGERME